jgi:predicted nucleic acid-binding protein
MIAVDTNILVYAHREDSEWHDRATEVVRELAEGVAAWVTLVSQQEGPVKRFSSRLSSHSHQSSHHKDVSDISDLAIRDS